jgi:subtilisin family serine protease
VYLIEVPAGADLEELLRELEDDARVVEGEEDRPLSSPEGGGATLPLGGDFFEFQIADQPELLRIGAAAARARATGAGVRVAVIDSGISPTHVSLAGHVEPGGWDFVGSDPDPTDEPNGLDDDGDGLVDEGFGHGTFVSSLVLALAPGATILPYRVLDSDSNGLASDVAEAIVRAADAGVDVINLSLGMEHRVLAVGEAVKHARERGVMVVVSAGNTGQEEVTFPASLSSAFSVTAVDASDVLAPFASWGGDVDVSAPGVELIGAYPTAPDAAVMWSGTSFSAALVTGTFALVRELDPLEQPETLLQRIRQTAVDVKALNPGEVQGKMGEGRLDADAATLGP